MAQYNNVELGKTELAILCYVNSDCEEMSALKRKIGINDGQLKVSYRKIQRTFGTHNLTLAASRAKEA